MTGLEVTGTVVMTLGLLAVAMLAHHDLTINDAPLTAQTDLDEATTVVVLACPDEITCDLSRWTR